MGWIDGDKEWEGRQQNRNRQNKQERKMPYIVV